MNQELEISDVILTKGLSKLPKDYEGYIIDKKTKKPKVKKDGTLQLKSIPAHVKLASKLIEQGIELYVGSKISYIVIKDKPIIAMDKETFIKENFNYEASYYWRRIIMPLLKVVYGYLRKIPDWSFNIKKSELNKLIKRLSLGDELDDEF
jgi:DNA polymerase elongation subunit (family B)